MAQHQCGDPHAHAFRSLVPFSVKALTLHAVPVYCHSDHVDELEHCEYFAALRDANLVHQYVASEWLDVAKDLRVLPHEVPHDAEPTFAFRCEGQGWAVGYAADLGTWDDALANVLADADVLAVEFNHDERMQKTSGRPQFLIDRVLGPHGHLSNRQGASLLIGYSRTIETAAGERRHRAASQPAMQYTGVG